MEPRPWRHVDEVPAITENAMRRIGSTNVGGAFRRGALAAAVCGAAILAGAPAASRAEQPLPVADPGALDDSVKPPLCCGVPPRDEVTADQVFGRWVVTHAGIGMPVREGEQVEFRTDGTVSTERGICRFAILRAELALTCADGAQSGEVRFEDDTKLIWRLDGRETIFIAPAD